MSTPTIEQLLMDLPPFIDDFNGRLFLHLQPWYDRSGWNAFYGAIYRDGWAVHPVFSEHGTSAADALNRLNDSLRILNFTLEADPNGEVEKAKGKPKKMGETSSS
jgi:hypothetical protein